VAGSSLLAPAGEVNELLGVGEPVRWYGQDGPDRLAVPVLGHTGEICEGAYDVQAAAVLREILRIGRAAAPEPFGAAVRHFQPQPAPGAAMPQAQGDVRVRASGGEGCHLLEVFPAPVGGEMVVDGRDRVAAAPPTASGMVTRSRKLCRTATTGRLPGSAGVLPSTRMGIPDRDGA